MVLRLAEALEVPPREQNQLLVAAGFAPAFGERPLDDPDMGSIRDGIERVLTAFEPYPALVVDRSWNLLQANSGVTALLTGLAPHLLEPPVNVLRLSLHPDGLAPRIRNLAAWRGHVLSRLGREAASPDRPRSRPCSRSCSTCPAVSSRRTTTSWRCRSSSLRREATCASSAPSRRSARPSTSPRPS